MPSVRSVAILLSKVGRDESLEIGAIRYSIRSWSVYVYRGRIDYRLDSVVSRRDEINWLAWVWCVLFFVHFLTGHHPDEFSWANLLSWLPW